MARTARKLSDSGMYHILLRGVCEIFKEEADRNFFKSLLEKYFSGDDCILLGCRFFEKKVHLVVKENKSTVSDAIKSLCTAYARYFNRTRNSEGKLFDGRYKSEPIETGEELKSCLRYIYRGKYIEYVEDESIKDKFTKKEIEKAEKILGMDDYASMTKEEMLSVIEYLCGGDENFEKLKAEEKAMFFHGRDEKSRVRIGLVLRALDVEKIKKVSKKAPENIKQKKDEKPKEKPKKKELSVWLL